MSTTNHLPIPTTLTGSNGDKYRIVEVLGQGSFGITYRARTKLLVEGYVGKVNTEIDVAVKEFYVKEINSRGSDECSVEGSQSDAFRRYLAHFRREAKTLERLGGRNGVVGVLDLFDANNTTYYVMEYLDGGSLDRKVDIKSGGQPLKEAEALRMTMQIGNALNYLHANRMLHLDLKPGNIMLRGNGEPMLIDFGMAKQFDDNGEPLSSSTLGNGTLGYAPTEQADYMPDSKSFPATIDIYALGATMYKMLCGVRPPSASVVQNDGLPMQPLIEAGVSANTQSVIKKAMSPLWKNRFQTVAEMTKTFDIQIQNNDCQSNEATILADDNDRKKEVNSLAVTDIEWMPWFVEIVSLIVTAVTFILIVSDYSQSSYHHYDTIVETLFLEVESIVVAFWSALSVLICNTLFLFRRRNTLYLLIFLQSIIGFRLIESFPYAGIDARGLSWFYQQPYCIFVTIIIPIILLYYIILRYSTTKEVKPEKRFFKICYLIVGAISLILYVCFFVPTLKVLCGW